MLNSLISYLPSSRETLISIVGAISTISPSIQMLENAPANGDLKLTSPDKIDSIQKFQKVTQELASYASLPDNWDGYGGVSAKKHIVNAAIMLVSKLHHLGVNTPTSMVSGSGCVGLFWRFSSPCTYVEINFDIEDNGMYSYFYELKGSFFGDEDIHVNDMVPEDLLVHIGLPKNTNKDKAEHVHNNAAYITELYSFPHEMLI